MGRLFLRYTLVILAVGAVWKLVAFGLASTMLPPPEDALATFAREIKTAVFWKHFWASARRAGAAMALAWVVAFPLGVLMGSRRSFDAWFAPFVFLTYPVPKIVLLPIVLLIFGLGDLSKIVLICLILGYQILVTTRDGVIGIHPKYLDSVKSLGAGPRQLFTEVLIPAALPHGFTALRLGVGTSVAVLFFVESFATSEGLGYFIMDGWSRMAYDLMFTGIFGLSLLGVLLYEVVNGLEKWCCAWKFAGYKTAPATGAYCSWEKPPMWMQQIQTYGRLIKFSHTIFALPFALAAVILAHQANPITGWTLLWIVVAMAGARSAAMGFNRWADYRFDAANPRTADRPNVKGEIGQPAVLLFLLVSSGVFVFAAGMLSRLCLYLSIPVLLVLFSYSYTKRFTSWSHLYLGFAIGLAPVGAWIAVTGGLDPRILLLSVALMTYIAGFDILYACQDVAFDRETGLFSLPARWGVHRSLHLSSALHVLTFLALLGLYLTFNLGGVYLGFLVLIGALLVFEHQLVKPQDLSRVNLAFFHVNSAISVLILLAVGIDRWLA